MVWIENPTNPLMTVFDVKAISKICKQHPDILLVLDNTFLTAYFQKSLPWGVDIVLYSLTKYMNGHSDVVMGATVTNSDELQARLKFLQNCELRKQDLPLIIRVHLIIYKNCFKKRK